MQFIRWGNTVGSAVTPVHAVLDISDHKRNKSNEPGRMANCFWSSEPISAAHMGTSSLCRMSSEEKKKRQRVMEIRSSWCWCFHTQKTHPHYLSSPCEAGIRVGSSQTILNPDPVTECDQITNSNYISVASHRAKSKSRSRQWKELCML